LQVTADQITVAVAACGRPEALARCLKAIAASSSQPHEVLVVDQHPSAAARDEVARCAINRARYLEQPRLGLSASRNLALREAGGTVLAVTDDDCAPQSGWLEAISSAFRRAPAPVAVTGPIVPLGMQPPGTHAISLRPVSTAIDCRGRILPWKVGSGGNFAARIDVLRREQGWNVRLGAGTAGKAAEDAELLYRLLRAGWLIRYDPDAVVAHEWQSWERRLQTRYSYAYGVGALCGMCLRRADRFAARMLLSYGNDHARALARAVRGHEWRAVNEHIRGLAGLGPGFLYGITSPGSNAR
jgi:O-antigen biosynthesis protein